MIDHEYIDSAKKKVWLSESLLKQIDELSKKLYEDKSINPEVAQKHLFDAVLAMVDIKTYEKKVNIPVGINVEEFEKIVKESLEEIYKEIGLEKEPSKD